MNIIKKGDDKIYFIDFDGPIEVLTKTKVQRESDEEDTNLLELITKTEVKRESDEEGISLVELLSKTFVDREKEDEEDIYYN